MHQTTMQSSAGGTNGRVARQSPLGLDREQRRGILAYLRRGWKLDG